MRFLLLFFLLLSSAFSAPVLVPGGLYYHTTYSISQGIYDRPSAIAYARVDAMNECRNRYPYSACELREPETEIRTYPACSTLDDLEHQTFANGFGSYVCRLSREIYKLPIWIPSGLYRWHRTSITTFRAYTLEDPPSDPPDDPPPPQNACSGLAGDSYEQVYNGHYSFSPTLCIGSCSVSSNFSARYYEAGQWTTHFVGNYTGESCTGSSGITETTPPALPDCEEGKRPGTVNGQLTCVPDPNHDGNGDDDGNAGGGGSGPGAQEIQHHGPYACIRDYKGEVDYELECVFCGVPGTKECEVALKNFDQLKQPLDKLVESTTEGNKILKDILEELKKAGAGGGSGGSGGGTGGGGGGTPPGPGGPGGGPGGGGGGGADPPGDGNTGEPGSFGGSCGAGFTCSGDAVQCAIAREIHQRGCSEFSAPSCDSPPVCKGDSVQCAIVTRQHELNCALRDTHGLTGEFEAVRSGDTDAKSQIRRGEIDISTELNTTNFLGSGSCVADYEVSIMGQSIVIPFSEYCPFLRAMGAILVVSSLLIAAMIVSAK